MSTNKKAKYTIVFVSNGKTDWNFYNIFTGWHDIALSKQGHQEAIEAGKYLKDKNFTFDIGITSALLRSHQTLENILEELQLSGIPIIKSWRLNERHYGALQGLRKDETIQIHGEEQVNIWRRSYEVRPPEMTQDDPEFLAKLPVYREIPLGQLPTAECLKDTEERVLTFWNETISNEIKEGKKIIVSAHRSSLKAIIKHLQKLSDEDIAELEILTAVPLVLELDENLEVVNRYCLFTEEELIIRRQNDEKLQQEAEDLIYEVESRQQIARNRVKSSQQADENSEPIEKQPQGEGENPKLGKENLQQVVESRQLDAENQDPVEENLELVKENPELLEKNTENIEQVDGNPEQVTEDKQLTIKNPEQGPETHEQTVETQEPVAEIQEQNTQNLEQQAESLVQVAESLVQVAETHQQVSEIQEQVTENSEQVTLNLEQVAQTFQQTSENQKLVSEIPILVTENLEQVYQNHAELPVIIEKISDQESEALT